MTSRKKLPKGWRWAKLTGPGIVEIDPKTPPPRDWNADRLVSFLPMALVDETSGTVREFEEAPFASCKKGKRRFQNGDVLFAKITPCVQNGKLAYIEDLNDPVGFGSTEFYVLRTGANLSAEYLWFFLRTSKVIEEAVASFTGTSGRQRVPSTFWENLHIPLPPLAEQERIVEVLRQADAIRRKRAEARRLADQILPALFLDMFGDPITNPKNWPVASLSDVLELIRNGTTSTQNTEEIGYPVSRIETISYETIDQTRVRWVDLDGKSLRKWRMESGDILFSHINSIEHIAKTALYLGDPPILIHGMNLLLLRPDQDRCLPVYLHALLKTPAIRDAFRKKAKQAVNQASLNQKDLKNQQMILPPLDEQKRFVYAAEEVQVQMEKQTGAVNDAERLFSVLLSRAFTGELTAEQETEAE